MQVNTFEFTFYAGALARLWVVAPINAVNTIANATKGGYINGNDTKKVVEYIKNTLNTIQKTEFESTQMADFQSQFQWFLGFAFMLLFLDVFFLERKTNWVKKLNLFNEKQ